MASPVFPLRWRMASSSPRKSKDEVGPGGQSPAISEQKDQRSQTQLVFNIEATEGPNSTKRFRFKLNPSFLRGPPTAHLKIDQVHGF